MKELVINDMCIAPSVIETVVSKAANDVEGVTRLVVPGGATGGIMGILGGAKQAPSSVVCAVDADDQLRIAVRIEAAYGVPLPELAQRVREAVADAVANQIGLPVGAVDIYVDGMQFNK